MRAGVAPDGVVSSVPEISYEGTDLESMSFALNYHRWMLELFAPYLGSRLVKLYDRCVVPFIKVAERIIPPPLGKNILLVAEKV